MALKKLDLATSLCVIHSNTRPSFHQYPFPLSPNKTRDSVLAFRVKRNSLAGTEIIHVCLQLAANNLQHTFNCALDCTPLLDRQDATSDNMALLCALAGLRDTDPIVVYHLNLNRKRNTAATAPVVRTLNDLW